MSLRSAWFAGAYALLAALAWSIALAWRGVPPIHCPDPWLLLPANAAHAFSLLLGLAIGGLIVMGTRLSVQRFEWARRLHRELRPIARTLDGPWIVVLALASAIGEELAFRGLLQPALGLLGQALLFGFLHQMRGPSRWVWVAWATLVGIVLGAVFQVTGSIVGPIVAHALVNAFNLDYLRRHDPDPDRRSLGGLLGRSRAT